MFRLPGCSLYCHDQRGILSCRNSSVSVSLYSVQVLYTGTHEDPGKQGGCSGCLGVHCTVMIKGVFCHVETSVSMSLYSVQVLYTGTHEDPGKQGGCSGCLGVHCTVMIKGVFCHVETRQCLYHYILCKCFILAHMKIQVSRVDVQAAWVFIVLSWSKGYFVMLRHQCLCHYILCKCFILAHMKIQIGRVDDQADLGVHCPVTIKGIFCHAETCKCLYH